MRNAKTLTKALWATGAIFFTAVELHAQVQGISASKLATLCTSTVPAKTIEFEPSWQIGWSGKYWNGDSKPVHKFSTGDSLVTSSGFGFRFSYGVGEKLEAGIAVPGDMTGGSAGIKYYLGEWNKLSLAVIGGSNFTMGVSSVSTNKQSHDESFNLACGLVSTVELSYRFSVDCDAQVQKCIRKTSDEHLWDYFLNADVGFWIIDGIQTVIGFNYSNSIFDDSAFSSRLLALNLGVTIEKAENFLLVLNSPVPISGKNEEIGYGLGMALTIMFD